MLLDIFHKLLIPFLGGFVVTLGKLIADQKLITWDEANDIALDMVLIAIGAVGVFYATSQATAVTETLVAAKDAAIDGGVVDALFGAILLYFRAARKRQIQSYADPPAVGALSGSIQLLLGLAAIIWTVKAF